MRQRVTSRYVFRASFLRWSMVPDDVEGCVSMMVGDWRDSRGVAARDA